MIGSAEAASPAPRGSSAVGGARSSVRNGTPVCWAMPLPIWVSICATMGLPPVAMSRVGPSGPKEMPP